MEPTQAEWIIHSVGAGIIALLWFFFTRDRVSNDKRLNNLEIQSREHSEELVRTDERHKNFRNDIDELKAGQVTVATKIDRVLLELRVRR